MSVARIGNNDNNQIVYQTFNYKNVTENKNVTATDVIKVGAAIITAPIWVPLVVVGMLTGCGGEGEEDGTTGGTSSQSTDDSAVSSDDSTGGQNPVDNIHNGKVEIVDNQIICQEKPYFGIYILNNGNFEINFDSFIQKYVNLIGAYPHFAAFHSDMNMVNENPDFIGSLNNLKEKGIFPTIKFLTKDWSSGETYRLEDIGVGKHDDLLVKIGQALANHNEPVITAFPYTPECGEDPYYCEYSFGVFYDMILWEGATNAQPMFDPAVPAIEFYYFERTPAPELVNFNADIWGATVEEWQDILGSPINDYLDQFSYVDSYPSNIFITASCFGSGSKKTNCIKSLFQFANDYDYEYEGKGISGVFYTDKDYSSFFGQEK